MLNTLQMRTLHFNIHSSLEVGIDSMGGRGVITHSTRCKYHHNMKCVVLSTTEALHNLSLTHGKAVITHRNVGNSWVP